MECPQTSEDIGFLGHHFHFCLSSNVFAVPGTPTEVLNMRLSCHRAIRVAREMMNAGVPLENIEIAERGATEEFPGGPEFNRVVVVQAIPPATALASGPNLPAATREDKELIVERARRILRTGNYNLGADAYLWTCGKIKRVSDAVDRMHVRFEGKTGLDKPLPLGTAEGRCTNVIVLSNAVLGASNQTDCVIDRLVEMAFHQMTLETLPTFDLRHRASRFPRVKPHEADAAERDVGIEVEILGALQQISVACLLVACAVTRRRFPVGGSPTRQTLQPEATGAAMEVTK